MSYSEKERIQQLLFRNAAWFVVFSVFLIVALVFASTQPTASIPSIYPQQDNTHWYKLSDTALVSEDGPTPAFKILVPVLLVCGAICLGLIYRELLNTKEDIKADEEVESAEENIITEV